MILMIKEECKYDDDRCRHHHHHFHDQSVDNAGCVQQNVLLASAPGPGFQYWDDFKSFCASFHHHHRHNCHHHSHHYRHRHHRHRHHRHHCHHRHHSHHQYQVSPGLASNIGMTLHFWLQIFK